MITFSSYNFLRFTIILDLTLKLYKTNVLDDEVNKPLYLK